MLCAVQWQPTILMPWIIARFPPLVPLLLALPARICGTDKRCAAVGQYYAFVEEKQKVHCLNTLFSKVRAALRPGVTGMCRT